MATPNIHPDRLPSPGRFTSLAGRGLAVIPIRHPDLDPTALCGKKGKEASVKWKRYQTHPPSTVQVVNWENDIRQPNVAVVTGKVSGVVVLDVDSPETLRELELRGFPLPATPRVRTGRGWHYYFIHPGRRIGSRTDLGGIEGLDFRGDGGYAIAPGSVHENGKRYAWELCPEEEAYAPLPEWVIELHRRTRASVERGTPACEDLPSEGRKSGGDPYCRAALDREADALAKTRKGSRNDRLNRAAFSLGQLVAGSVLSAAEVESTLRSACERNGLIQDDGEAAFQTSFASGLAAGMAHPRTPMPRQIAGGDPANEPPGESSVAVVLSAPFTDLGNAERLQALFGDRIRFCLERGWYVWNGHAWDQDLGPSVPALAAQAARKTLQTATHVEDEDKRKALIKHALKFESAHQINAAVTLARGMSTLQVHARDLDSDPWILNTPSAMLDLRSGCPLPHDPRQLCTRITGVPFEPGRDCPRWEEFLLQVFGQNIELVLFMQRAIGMTLTGSTSEQVLFFLWGSGANGKSVLLETLRFVLGTYARTAPMALWLSDRNERANNATPDLAALQGARFVTSIESNAERRLNEGMVKAVTGGDRLSARELFGRSFEMEFVGKLFCASNHRPVIKGTDDGIWRRFLLIPFTQTFVDPKDPKDIQPGEKDKDLPGKLRAEGSGILRWAVEGCLAWQKSCLCPPAEVRVASKEYREEQDRLGAWLSERCTRDPNISAPFADLYNDFTAWAQVNEEEVMSQKAFGHALGERGFASHRTDAARQRKGLALVDGCAQLAIGEAVHDR